MDNEKYETPKIVFEGDLEVQAGTPGLPADLDDIFFPD